MPTCAMKTLLLTYRRLFESSVSSRRRRRRIRSTLLFLALTGCASSSSSLHKTIGNDTCEVDAISSQIDNPAPPAFREVSMTAPPITGRVVAESELIYLDRSLDQVLRDALQHSAVLRDIGGMILRAPDTVTTSLATRLQQTDPRFGMEAALSAFDAQLAASAMFNNNNRIYNNAFFAGGTTSFDQDYHAYQVELSKRTATGSLLSVRGINNFDGNNAPANTFTSAWDSWIEGEIRQPLLQGGGLEFNRIAGPGSTPGVYNGVLIAKANADINHADFTVALTDFIGGVENAYWDLYISYRELDARKKAMEQALVVWNETMAQKSEGAIKEADEALARQQYYQLKAEVDEALSGRLLPGTQTRNGATIQAGGGVLAAERRLRLLIGLPASDGVLIRPSEEPTMASIHFDWNSCLNEALTQRPELQKQNIAVKKRELELLAAKNFVNPRLDAVGRYRVRGFGDDLVGNGVQTGTAPASSFGNLATGDHQEWMLGVELTVPIGYRKAYAAVDHAELAIARERIIQKEQQREVVSNLAGAIADTVRAYQAVQNNLNQYLAAESYSKALAVSKRQGQTVESDRLLDAQRRLVQAEVQFFRSRAEYAISLKNIHYEKGTLLTYKDLRIAGGSMSAYRPSADSDPLPPVPDSPPDLSTGGSTTHESTLKSTPVSAAKISVRLDSDMSSSTDATPPLRAESPAAVKETQIAEGTYSPIR